MINFKVSVGHLNTRYIHYYLQRYWYWIANYGIYCIARLLRILCVLLAREIEPKSILSRCIHSTWFAEADSRCVANQKKTK